MLALYGEAGIIGKLESEGLKGRELVSMRQSEEGMIIGEGLKHWVIPICLGYLIVLKENE